MGRIDDAPTAAPGWYPMPDGKPGKRYWDGEQWTGRERGVTRPLEERVSSGIGSAFGRRELWISGAIATVCVLGIVFLTLFPRPFVSASDSREEVSGTVEVPRVLGMIYEGARANLEKAGLRDAGSCLPGEIVRSQGIPAETLIAEGDAVVLVCEIDPFLKRDPISNFPDGFKDVGNGVAYRFANEGRECSYSSCVFVELYAYQNCPSMVYVQAKTVDRDTNTVYGMTNDTLGGLSRGQSGVVELPILESAANGVQLTEINCY